MCCFVEKTVIGGDKWCKPRACLVVCLNLDQQVDLLVQYSYICTERGSLGEEKDLEGKNIVRTLFGAKLLSPSSA